MKPINNTQTAYERAKNRVDELKKFYQNLFSYLIFITLLAVLNYYVNELRNPWFLWAAFGWGIGIISHAIKAFHFNPFYNKEWEKRKIDEFMKKEHSQRWE